MKRLIAAFPKLILVLLLFCQQASTEPDTSEAQVSENTGKTVVIGIEESLYDDSDIQKSIKLYLSDLENEGWEARVQILPNRHTVDVHEFHSIVDHLYERFHMDGLVLVGHFPSDHESYTDQRLTERSGLVLPTLYDEGYFLRRKIRFWLSRIDAAMVPALDESEEPLVGEEKQLLMDYFHRNHQFRNSYQQAGSLAGNLKYMFGLLPDGAMNRMLPSIRQFLLRNSKVFEVYNPDELIDSLNNGHQFTGILVLGYQHPVTEEGDIDFTVIDVSTPYAYSFSRQA